MTNNKVLNAIVSGGMSPNATDSSAILREERKMPNGCTNGWSGVSESAKQQRWKGQAVLKVNEMVEMVKHYALRAYIIFWREYMLLLLFESGSMSHTDGAIEICCAKVQMRRQKISIKWGEGY